MYTYLSVPSLILIKVVDWRREGPKNMAKTWIQPERLHYESLEIVYVLIVGA